MTEIRKKYKIIHIHYYEDTQTVLLYLDPLDRLPRTAAPIMVPGGTEEERVIGGMVQATFKAMQGVIPPQYQEEKLLKIEISLEDYEKLGSPGILDEIMLTLDAAKETTG